MNTTVYSCIDVDECLSVPNLCGKHSSCVNTVGSYKCGCAVGFSKHHSGGDCQRNILERTMISNLVDETTVVDKCSPDKDECGENSYCSNSGEGFVCACQEGFLRNVETSSCEDIDECIKAELCGVLATCVNTNGGYECMCQDGYSGNPLVECKDLDECSSGVGGESVCGANANCRNTEGGFECKCQDFYVGNPPVTACTFNCAAKCGVNSECASTGQVDECACKEGYAGDPPSLPCQDIDECLEQPCGPNAVCSNSVPGYSCTCKSGYVGDANVGCHRVSLCSTPLDCVANTTCLLGSCKCKAGYYPEGDLCLDKDECILSPDICSENSECMNIVGGYLCLCKPGFDRYPPNYFCTTENKCKTDCGENSKCNWVEEEQIDRCVCDEGYVGLLTGGCVPLK